MLLGNHMVHIIRPNPTRFLSISPLLFRTGMDKTYVSPQEGEFVGSLDCRSLSLSDCGKTYVHFLYGPPQTYIYSDNQLAARHDLSSLTGTQISWRKAEPRGVRHYYPNPG